MMDKILSIKTVGEAVTLLKAYAHEEPQLKPEIKKITFGINIPFHYLHYEQGLYHYKEKKGILHFNVGGAYKIEGIWEEIDDRIALSQKLLLDHMQNDKAYEEENI
jgi:hypothetical protein